MAEHLNYYDYEPGRTVTCPACRWIGGADENQEFHGDLFDVSCGGCGQLLLVVPFPTLAEVREAAAAGNERAIADLPDIERQAAVLAEAKAIQLERPDQLPELPDEL